MKIELIQYDHVNHYYHTSIKNNKLDNLVSFLEHEIERSNGERWINFLIKSDYKIFIGEIMEIEHQDHMAYIKFAQLTSYDKSDDDPYIIEKKKLIELIKEWRKLVEQNVEKIIVEEINGEVHIYGQ